MRIPSMPRPLPGRPPEHREPGFLPRPVAVPHAASRGRNRTRPSGRPRRPTTGITPPAHCQHGRRKTYLSSVGMVVILSGLEKPCRFDPPEKRTRNMPARADMLAGYGSRVVRYPLTGYFLTDRRRSRVSPAQPRPSKVRVDGSGMASTVPVRFACRVLETTPNPMSKFCVSLI